MRNLVLLEFYKLFKQSRTYVAIIALLCIELVVLASAYYQGEGIIDIVLSNLKDTFIFEGNLLNGNLVIYFILNSFWFHVPLLCIIIVSGMLTSEYKDGTLQTVMMQPIVKWKYLLAKYMVATFFTIALVAVLACTSFLFSYGLFGRGDLVVYTHGLSFFEHSDAFKRLLYAFSIGTLSIVFYSIVSITIAVLLKEAMKTWIVAAFFLIISTLLLKVSIDNKVVDTLAYFKLNNTWQYVFEYDIDWELIGFNCMLLTVYSIITVGIGLWVFQKKDIG
jgi:ABC-2 type transport system permease protein